MLMTIRNNGIFYNQQDHPKFDSSYAAKGPQVTDTVVEYTGDAPLSASNKSSNYHYSPSSSANGSFASTQKANVAAARRSPPLMNALLGNAPAPQMYVRALYDYEADDRTSLSFHEGDVIQVITQLESGWWDGVINGVRGWFPSNYCQVIANPDDALDGNQNGNAQLDDGDAEDEEEETEEYEDQYEEDDTESEREDVTQLPIEGRASRKQSRADFWIPQATPDGRLFYFNTETGQSSI